MPLNKNFYALAVFTSGLHGAIYLIQGIIFVLIGQQIYTVSVFFPWYLFFNIILFVASLLYLNYFRLKKFDLAFWTTLANLVTEVAPAIIFIGVFTGRREWISLYLPAQMIVLTTTILLGLALIFSHAGKRPWLKISGIFFVVAGIVLLAVSIGYLNSTFTSGISILERITKWVSLSACVGPFLIMMNFLDEQKQLRPEDAHSTQPRISDTLISGLQVVAMLATLFFAFKIMGETVQKLSWERELARKTAHWEKVWGARTFRGSQGDPLRYQLIYPDHMDSTRKYPMVVCLPYGGGIEGSPAAEYLLTEANRKKYPAFLFVPFCPNGSGWGGIPNYPTIDTLVFETIEAVEHEFNAIDADKVYITGVSRGGYGSWHFISLRPDLFAAAMPVCGEGNPKLAANMVDVAVWAFHGEDDPGVPVNGSRDMIAAIKKSGGNPKYTEFADAGHNIWNYVTTTPGVFDWLFEQKRKSTTVSSTSDAD